MKKLILLLGLVLCLAACGVDEVEVTPDIEGDNSPEVSEPESVQLEYQLFNINEATDDEILNFVGSLEIVNSTSDHDLLFTNANDLTDDELLQFFLYIISIAENSEAFYNEYIIENQLVVPIEIVQDQLSLFLDISERDFSNISDINSYFINEDNITFKYYDGFGGVRNILLQERVETSDGYEVAIDFYDENYEILQYTKTYIFDITSQNVPKILAIELVEPIELEAKTLYQGIGENYIASIFIDEITDGGFTFLYNYAKDTPDDTSSERLLIVSFTGKAELIENNHYSYQCYPEDLYLGMTGEITASEDQFEIIFNFPNQERQTGNENYDGLFDGTYTLPETYQKTDIENYYNQPVSTLEININGDLLYLNQDFNEKQKMALGEILSEEPLSFPGDTEGNESGAEIFYQGISIIKPIEYPRIYRITVTEPGISIFRGIEVGDSFDEVIEKFPLTSDLPNDIIDGTYYLYGSVWPVGGDVDFVSGQPVEMVFYHEVNGFKINFEDGIVTTISYTGD